MTGPTTQAEIRDRYETGRLLNDPGLTGSAAPGFGTWRQASADTPVLVSVAATAETDGTSAGEVVLDVDEDGDGTADYTLALVDVVADHAAGTAFADTIASLYLSAGAQYQVRNVSDPNANNSLDTVREVTL
jgi:hypothetical protein